MMTCKGVIKTFIKESGKEANICVHKINNHVYVSEALVLIFYNTTLQSNW